MADDKFGTDNTMSADVQRLLNDMAWYLRRIGDGYQHRRFHEWENEERDELIGRSLLLGVPGWPDDNPSIIQHRAQLALDEWATANVGA